METVTDKTTEKNRFVILSSEIKKYHRGTHKTLQQTISQLKLYYITVKGIFVEISVNRRIQGGRQPILIQIPEKNVSKRLHIDQIIELQFVSHTLVIFQS